MDVGISVEVSASWYLVDHGVGGKEATHGGVIDAPVHIDEIKIVDHLVAGKALVVCALSVPAASSAPLG